MALNSDLQIVIKNQFETAVSLAGKLAGNANEIAHEVQDFSLTSVQAHAALVSELASARTVEQVIRIQTDHVKAAYEATLARSRKIGDLLTDISSNAVKSAAAGAERKAGQPRSPAEELQAAE
jgi:hypothetical protein